MSTTTLPGGWSPYHKPSAEDLAVFKEALSGFVGVHYTPQTVSTQIVAGENYRFKAEATVPPSEIAYEVVIQIFKPLKGKPHIVSIHHI